MSVAVSGGQGRDSDALNGGELLALVEWRATRVLDLQSIGLRVLCDRWRVDGSVHLP